MLCSPQSRGAKRCEMATQILPAASLRSGNRFPAGRALLSASNPLLWMALWSIGQAILRVGSSFSLLSGRNGALEVEPEAHHVAVLDDVIRPLQAHTAGIPGALLAAIRGEIGIGDRF